MYADFACPRCAVAAVRLRDEGTRVAFRHFALRARHPRSVALALAAEAAAAQGAVWAVHDALYDDQGPGDDPPPWGRCGGPGLDPARVEADPRDLGGRGERLGLALAGFEAARRGEPAAERVRRDTREGMRAGVTGTPALIAPSVN